MKEVMFLTRIPWTSQNNIDKKKKLSIEQQHYLASSLTTRDLDDPYRKS